MEHNGRMRKDGWVRRLGAMGFLSLKKEAYSGTDLEFLQQVGKQVAVAVDNALNFASTEAAQQSLARERDRLSLVLEINNAVVSHLELKALRKSISDCLSRVLPHDLAGFCLYDPATNTFSSAGANAYARLYHSASVLLPDATVLLLGGNPQRGNYESRLEVYSPSGELIGAVQKQWSWFRRIYTIEDEGGIANAFGITPDSGE